MRLQRYEKFPCQRSLPLIYCSVLNIFYIISRKKHCLRVFGQQFFAVFVCRLTEKLYLCIMQKRNQLYEDINIPA